MGCDRKLTTQERGLVPSSVLNRTAFFVRSMAASNRRLVDEANLVSREMMDVAITWHEFW